MSEEGHFEGGTKGVSSQPVYHLRSATPLNLGTAIALLVCIIGILTFVLQLNNRVQDVIDIKLQNERNERINQLNKVEQRLDKCCARRW